ncbi:hypothetical protein [Nocardia farcinica]|uniref:hypothetical protein n=1 Tax=Nocardia farcinica TaxID=37329 RepID=UPI0024585B66|nr:hypothetical protein [Nocardia farcinica]
MTERINQSPSWVIDIAESLRGYLEAAAALPPPAAPPIAGRAGTGWYAEAPDAPLAGRTPWIHLRDIAVSCIDEVIIVAYRWRRDDPATAPRYLLPLTTTQTDTMTGTDELITRLDLFLDSGHWREQHTYPIGNRTSVVVVPERRRA